MSVLNFAEDFSRLVMRYMKDPSPNSNRSKDAIVPLTDKQVVFTVRHVLYGLGIKDDNNNDDNSQIKTPVNEITVITPTAPIAPKINHEQNDENAYRFQNAQLTDFAPSILDTSLKANKTETENTLQNEKKFISRSNPTICVNSIGRSDTFVREEKKAKTNSRDDVFEDGFTSAEVNDLLSGRILKPLSEVRESAMFIVTKLDNLKKTFPQLTKQIQLSSSGGFSNLQRTSNMAIKTRMPMKFRRSITAFPGTPTSSRSLAIDKGDTYDRRKSTGGMMSGIVTAGKLNEAAKISRAASNLNLSVCGKVSPGSCPRPAKNPKYAHVRSTIPKPIGQSKRKAQ